MSGDHKHPTGECVLEMERVVDKKIEPILERFDATRDLLVTVTHTVERHSEVLQEANRCTKAELAAIKADLHGPEGHGGVVQDMIVMKAEQKKRDDRINGIRSWLAANALLLFMLIAPKAWEWIRQKL